MKTDREKLIELKDWLKEQPISIARGTHNYIGKNDYDVAFYTNEDEDYFLFRVKGNEVTVLPTQISLQIAECSFKDFKLIEFIEEFKKSIALPSEKELKRNKRMAKEAKQEEIKRLEKEIKELEA